MYEYILLSGTVNFSPNQVLFCLLTFTKIEMNIAYQIMYASSGLCLLICLFVTMGLRLSKIYEQLVQTF